MNDSQIALPTLAVTGSNPTTSTATTITTSSSPTTSAFSISAVVPSTSTAASRDVTTQNKRKGNQSSCTLKKNLKIVLSSVNQLTSNYYDKLTSYKSVIINQYIVLL